MPSLIPDFILNNYKKNSFKGYFDSYSVFADISGFTSMTNTLMNAGNEGAEILCGILNKLFKKTVKFVHENNGFITDFAGDAFTALFTSSDFNNALACVNKILEDFKSNSVQNTKYGTFEFKIRAGIGFGKINWEITGEKFNYYYFEGPGISDSIEAEEKAKSGEIVCSLNARNNHILKPDKLFSDNLTKLNIINQKIFARKFIPEPIINSNPNEAEFRDVISLFITFSDNSDYQTRKYFLDSLTDTVNLHNGYLKEIDFGEKGKNVIIFWGAPLAYEDIVIKPFDFLKDINSFKSRKELSGEIKFKAGITYGKVYAGFIGGEERLQYSLIGSKVNLCSRLMTAAAWNEIWMDENIDKRIKDIYTSEDIGVMNFKGFSSGEQVYKINIDSLYKSITQTPAAKCEEAFFGRNKELKEIKNLFYEVKSGQHGNIISISGEPGIGKSKLIDKFKENISKEENVNWFYCPSNEFLNLPFYPFKYFLSNYFNQSNKNSLNRNKKNYNDKFSQLIEQLKNNIPKFNEKEFEINSLIIELDKSRSVLAALVNLNWNDSLYNKLDPKLKYENTLYILFNFFIAHTYLSPLVLEFDNFENIDEDSKELLKLLGYAISNYPVLIIALHRKKLYEDNIKQIFNTTNDIEQIYLKNLDMKEISKLCEFVLNIRSNLKFNTFIYDKTAGNPFFAIQLLKYIKERNLENEILNSDSTLKHLEIPSNIKEIILSRFDKLSDDLKKIIHTASVLGREFEINLLSNMLKDESHLHIKYRRAEQEEIWILVNEIKYFFKHGLFRDIVYEMQLKSRLNELHLLAAGSIKEVNKDNLNIDNLEAYCYHFGVGHDIINQSFEFNKHYAELHFENYDLIFKEYLNELIKLFNKFYGKYLIRGAISKCNLIIEISNNINSKDLHLKFLLQKAELLKFTGEYDSALSILDHVEKDSEKLELNEILARCYHQKGFLMERKSKYDEAVNYYNKSLNLYERLNLIIESADIYGNIGVINFHKGEYDTAMNYFLKKKEMSEKNNYERGLSSAYGNMGLVYLNKGDFDSALKYFEFKKSIDKETNNLRGLSNVLGNMGILFEERGEIEKAYDHYMQKIKIIEEMDEKRELARTNGNIGNIFRIKKDYEKAMIYYNSALKISRFLNDENIESGILGIIGTVFKEKGEFLNANEYLNMAIDKCKKLNLNLNLCHFCLESIELSRVNGYINNIPVLIELGLKAATKIRNDFFIEKYSELSARQ
ncbi:MAG: adenylate/guanylate cyclase domain-containing protein [bacterium]